MNDQVAISGVGLLTAVGLDAEECWTRIRDGRSGIRRATSVDAEGFISELAGELPGGSAWNGRVPRRVGRGPVDRCHAMALDAASEAIADAGLLTAGYASDRIGISLGTSLGGARAGELFHRQWLRDGLRRANSTLLKTYPLHSVSDYLAEQFGFGGPRTVQSNACAAGAVAIAYGVELILSGQADAVIAGGVDPLALLSFGGFSCLGALDPQHTAPYTRSAGLNLGEGAGIVVLERLRAVGDRGRQPPAIVAGYGLSADAHHATAPDPTGRGALRAMQAALRMAGLDADALDYVNGHGTGTPANDSVESRAITRLRPGQPPPTSSTKSMVGHTLGAAGAVEAVVTVLSVRDGILPPTVTPDPDIEPANGLDIVAGRGRPAGVAAALSNSFAFGGNNAALLFQERSAVAEPVRPATRPVVVTGVAALAGTAGDSDALNEALRESRRLYGSEYVELDGFGRYLVAEIPARHLTRGINPAALRRIDTLGRRAAVATGDLLRRRALTRDECASTGLLFATGTGPLSTVEAFQRELIHSGAGNTRLFPNTVMNAAGGHVALLHRLQGPTATISAGGTSGISALHFATRLIERGTVDRMIVLAADEAPAALLAPCARIPGFLSRDECQPFGASGKFYGGASVALLLEAQEAAREDRILGRVAGFGLTGDGSGAGQIDPGSDAWARSFRAALVDACLQPDDLDLVIAAACGHPPVDDLELRSLATGGLDDVAISAPKSLFGDIGASGGLLGVAQALWMRGAAATVGTYAIVRGATNAGRPVHRSLVSTYEVGGNYQSVVVCAAYA